MNRPMLAIAERRGSTPIDKNPSCGIKYANNNAPTSRAYNGGDGRTGNRADRNTASITLHKIAKKTSELTSHVEPNKREKVTRLRVSKSENAAPRKNMWPLKPRRAVAGARPKISPSAITATIARPATYTQGKAGLRKYISGHSSVACVGADGSSSPATLSCARMPE